MWKIYILFEMVSNKIFSTFFKNFWCYFSLQENKEIRIMCITLELLKNNLDDDTQQLDRFYQDLK